VIQFSRKGMYMVPPFVILTVENGKVTWLEAAADLEGAKARVKELSAFLPSEYIILNLKTGEKISTRPNIKRIIFQIGYDAKGLTARAELLRRFGHEVISVADNDAAKVALTTIHDVDLFIVGHTAPKKVREEIVSWLKTNYPKVKILALNPSKDQLIHADYNVVLNHHDEWLSLLAAAAS